MYEEQSELFRKMPALESPVHSVTRESRLVVCHFYFYQNFKTPVFENEFSCWRSLSDNLQEQDWINVS